MRIPLLFCLFAVFAPLFAAGVRAQEAAEGPTAEEIVNFVHLSRALRKYDLNGVLEKNGKEVPFNVRMRENLIQFTFTNPAQTVTLDINDKGAKLTEAAGRGRAQAVPAKRYSEGIRGTDLTYDDISFRYLYWPQKVKQPLEETVKTRKCHVVDLYNPDQNGDYGVVRIFVDKQNGALMRIRGYDRQNRMIKECSVTAGMKLPGGETILKTMSVHRHDPATGKVIGETSFELKRPK